MILELTYVAQADLKSSVSPGSASSMLEIIVMNPSCRSKTVILLSILHSSTYTERVVNFHTCGWIIEILGEYAGHWERTHVLHLTHAGVWETFYHLPCKPH